MSKTIFRLQQLIIDVPVNTAEPFIHLYIQKVIRDDSGNDVQVIDRYHQVHKKLFDVVFQTANVHDVVTGQDYTASVAGVDRAIRGITLAWMLETFGGKISGDELDITGVNIQPMGAI